MIDPGMELLRQLLATAPADPVANLRAEINADYGAIRAPLADQMRKSGSYVRRSKARQIDGDGTQRENRDAHREALRLHGCSRAQLRENFESALQNAAGWLWVLIAAEGHWTIPGAIGVAARRALQPFHPEDCEPEVGPYTAEDKSADLLASLLNGKRTEPARSWDWIDYAAAREGRARHALRQLLRGKRSVVLMESETYVGEDEFACELPTPPAVTPERKTPERPVAYRPATSPAADKLVAEERRRDRCRSHKAAMIAKRK